MLDSLKRLGLPRNHDHHHDGAMKGVSRSMRIRIARQRCLFHIL
jgi:hypothetical protein